MKQNKINKIMNTTLEIFSEAIALRLGNVCAMIANCMMLISLLRC